MNDDKNTPIELSVYDINGNIVTELDDEFKNDMIIDNNLFDTLTIDPDMINYELNSGDDYNE